MRRVWLFLLVIIVVPSVARGKTKFIDDFENVNTDATGALASGEWNVWEGPYHSNLRQSGDHHHDGISSVCATNGDPYVYCSYADFGTTDESIRAEVYVYEEMNVDGNDPSKPATCMLALFGDADSPQDLSDYLELGVVAYPPGKSKHYCIRTRYDDTVDKHVIDTGVGRKKEHWTKLAIEVDSVNKGGEARFYIDDKQVGTSYRAGAKNGVGKLEPVKFRWVRLGNSEKTYENFWYDDVSVRSLPLKTNKAKNATK
jgi:hypothetical protein